jgi:hypothetical protein
LTILERAQLLHDATLRRHADMLETHAETLTVLRGIQERQESLRETLATIAAQHTERMPTLQQTLDAIKDLLDRGNGH